MKVTTCTYSDRTIHVPHIYYYRRRDGATNIWHPWNLVELDIEGDHLIPVVWNRKLMVIWPIFNEKSIPKDVEMPEPGQKITSGDRYWEIQLAWSEYQNGRWSGKNLSDPVTFTAYLGEDNVLFGPRVAAPTNSTIFLRPRQDNGGEPLPDRPGGGEEDPGDPIPHHPHPTTPGVAKPRRLVSKELFFFKAFTPGDRLTVRGFLRRDYRRTPVAGDTQIACCIGEFRFSGCRKIVTTAYRARIPSFNFPLAPAGTKFYRMGFLGTSGRLNVFDGEFPAFTRPLTDVTAINDVNEPESIAGDPSGTQMSKVDITVFDSVPSTFQIMAPHQDPQFICNRPFFFTDSARTFIVTSTGTSGFSAGPRLGDWVVGDLTTTWRADYFPKSQLTPEGPVISSGTGVLQPFTVLLPGSNGQRVRC